MQEETGHKESGDPTGAGGQAASGTILIDTDGAGGGLWRRAAILAGIVLLLGLPIRLIIADRAAMVSRDTVTFIWYAQALADAPLQALRSHDQHPLYPLSVLAAHEVVRRAPILPVSLREDPIRSWTLAAVAVTMLGGLAAIVAVYLFTSALFDPQIAFVAAVLAAAGAELAQLSADGLTDMPHLAIYLLAMWAGLRGCQSARVPWFVLAGLFAGLGYLTRPEGAEPAVVVCGLLILPWVGQLNWRRRAVAVACVTIAAAAVASPYMAATGKLVRKKPLWKFVEPAETVRSDSPGRHGEHGEDWANIEESDRRRVAHRSHRLTQMKNTEELFFSSYLCASVSSVGRSFFSIEEYGEDYQVDLHTASWRTVVHHGGTESTEKTRRPFSCFVSPAGMQGEARIRLCSSSSCATRAASSCPAYSLQPTAYSSFSPCLRGSILTSTRSRLHASIWGDVPRALGPIVENWVRSLRVTFLLPAVLWLVWRRRLPGDAVGMRMVQAAILLHILILIALIVRFDYWSLFSLRHVMVLTGLTLPFAAAGVVVMVESLPEARQGLAALLIGLGLIVPTLPWMFETRHRDDAHFRVAAEWMRQNTAGPARILSDRHRMAFYAAGDYIPAPLEASAGEYLARARTARPDWIVFDERRILKESPEFFENLQSTLRPGESLNLAEVVSNKLPRGVRRVLIYRYTPPG